MRGIQNRQAAMFSYISQEDRIPENHPLRILRTMVDPILESLSGRFEKLYADTGRPSIPPEQLLRALLVQILYTIRSERLLMEQLDYNLLFRWFVGLSMDDAVWNHSVFGKNRDRLLSDEHFTVDGTLIEAWAGQKSFKKKDEMGTSTTDDPGNPTVNFHGQQRTNDTHQSTTDPEARLFRKGPGREAKLSFMGHVTIDNRHGLVVATRYTQATGKAEREAATQMAKGLTKRHKGRKTVGADKAYDTGDLVARMRKLAVTPHVAQNDTNRSSAIDDRTTRHAGYAISQRKRKLVEEIFGWVKTIGLMRKTRHKGVNRGGWMFTFTNAIYNLIRIKNLVPQPC